MRWPRRRQQRPRAARVRAPTNLPRRARVCAGHRRNVPGCVSGSPVARPHRDRDRRLHRAGPRPSRGRDTRTAQKRAQELLHHTGVAARNAQAMPFAFRPETGPRFRTLAMCLVHHYENARAFLPRALSYRRPTSGRRPAFVNSVQIRMALFGGQVRTLRRSKLANGFLETCVIFVEVSLPGVCQ